MMGSRQTPTWRLPVFGAALVIVCVLAGLTAPPARADLPPFWEAYSTPTLPAGATDPADAFTRPAGTSGAYPTAARNDIIQKRFMYGPQVWEQLKGTRNTAQFKYELSRIQRMQNLLRLTASKRSLITFVRFASPTGVLLTAGVMAWQINRSFTDADGNPATDTQFIAIERGELGGQEVVLPPGLVQGQHYKANPRMGWRYVGDLSGASGPAGVHPGWVFEYQLQLWAPSGASGNVWSNYPADEKWANDHSDIGNVSKRYHPVPDADYCLASSSNLTQCISADGAIRSIPSTTTQPAAYAAWATVAALDGMTVPLKVTGDLLYNNTGHPQSGNSCQRSGALPPNCGMAYIGADAFERGVGVPSTTRPAGSTIEGTINHTVPADAGNDADRAALLADLTPCARAIVNHIIDPGNYPAPDCEDTAGDADGTGGAVVVPTTPTTPTTSTVTHGVFLEVLEGETFSEYVARLRAAGYLGTITRVDTDALNDPAYDPLLGYDPELGPNVVLTTSPAPGSAWTVTAGVAAPAGVQVITNPGTAPRPPGGGGVEAPGLDFGPITDLDPGCKFPYGFICYAVQVTEWFDVSPDAPRFAFDAICVANPAGGELCAGEEGETFVVDLNVMDEYMALLRGLMSVALWIGGVYLLATRLLGFRAGGDPGEAVDEGLDWS